MFGGKTGMSAKQADLKELESWYAKTGNQLILLYGGMDCRKEQLIREFLQGKKFFYYRCRQLSEQEQLACMGEEIQKKLQVKLNKQSYDEYFNRIKSGDASKLVLVIDEVQYLVKRNPDFLKSIIKLKTKRLYPGPVMIILATSSLVWAQRDAKEAFGEDARRIDLMYKLKDLDFLEVVRAFPSLSVSESIQVYGTIGGVPGFMDAWDETRTYKENVCKLILKEDGYLFHMAQQMISAELREFSVYNTILSTIAQGYQKLNDLYLKTGFSRAKISVYIKNLSHFDIVEKVQSFETGGWENAKKGVYQIKNTFINFWFKFVFPHLSDLYLMNETEFYEQYIAPELGAYMKRYFRNICMEYMELLNQLGRLPFPIHKMGTWVGKTGNIDIIAQSTDRRNMVGLCNWDQPMLTMQMCEKLYESMEKAKIRADKMYLFSATQFEPILVERAEVNPWFELIDMNEL